MLIGTSQASLVMYHFLGEQVHIIIFFVQSPSEIMLVFLKKKVRSC